ncbi:MAG: prolipoprotein diacylglyceryl transferase family protein [Actinomycetota bacterium]
MTEAFISWRPVSRWHVFGITLFPHGLLIAAGILVGAAILRRETRRRGIVDDLTLEAMLFRGIVGGLIGTRLAWLAGHYRELGSPLEVFALWHGGMSLLGGLAGSVLAVVPLARKRKVRLLALLDAAAPGFAAGIALGRVSDLIIGDHLGKPTGLPWGFRYVGGDPVGMPPPLGVVVHPSALYDLASLLALFGVLLWFRRRGRAEGSIAGLFTLWYATGRFLGDFTRDDPVRALGLSGSQIVTLIAILVVSAALILRSRRGDASESRPSSGTTQAEDGRVKVPASAADTG